MKRSPAGHLGPRQHMVAVRFSVDEFARLEKKAADADLAVTTYVREASLNREINPRIQMVEQLRQLAALQKKLCAAGQGVGATEYGRVLLAITDAIERIAADRPGAVDGPK